MAKRIEELDQNFQAKKLQSGFLYHDLYEYEAQGLLKVGGLYPKTFCRMNPDVLIRMPDGMRELAFHTAGGAVRFQIPGGRFSVRMEVTSGWDMGHMPRSGMSGLDVYVGSGTQRRFMAGLRPDRYGQTEIEGDFTLPAGEEEVTLYLPLYNGISSLELGFPAGVSPALPTPYRIETPIVYYGSSITQGGCASRTGNCYPNMISRMLDANTINLGFSGNGKGEPIVSQYIAGLTMSAFVLDYDHNAPDAAYLQQTHLPFLKTILQAQPKLPVLIVSKPDFTKGSEDDARRAIILRSYLWARDQGYRVAFADGATFFDGPMSGDCTVDGCHPSDLGFSRMAAALAPMLLRLMD